MPICDDEQFEKYLKQFLPVMTEPLPVLEQIKPKRRPLIFAAWAGVAAVILLAVMVTVLRHKPDEPISHAGTNTPGIETRNIETKIVETQNNVQPLTIASANALLANAPSFKAAVESMTFQPSSKQVSQGRLSALAVLSKEDSKL